MWLSGGCQENFWNCKGITMGLLSCGCPKLSQLQKCKHYLNHPQVLNVRQLKDTANNEIQPTPFNTTDQKAEQQTVALFTPTQVLQNNAIQFTHDYKSNMLQHTQQAPTMVHSSKATLCSKETNKRFAKHQRKSVCSSRTVVRHDVLDFVITSRES